MLIDDAIPGDKNVIKKAAKKMLKYKHLTTEIHHMWNVRATVIPVIREVTGTISKSLRQYLSNITGKNKIKGEKKPPHTHTAAESANVKYKTYFTGEIT